MMFDGMHGSSKLAEKLDRILRERHVANALVGQHALLHAERHVELLHVANALRRKHEIGGKRLVILLELPLRPGVLAVILASCRRERLDEGLA
jgi:hypothetical protein